MTNHSLRLLSILAVVSLAACSGSGDADPVLDSGVHVEQDGGEPADAATAGADASTSEDASVEPGPDAGPGPGPDAGSEPGPDAGSEPGPDAGPVGSCGELGGANCLSNQDCAADAVCKRVVPEDVFGCCVVGSRGDKAEGAECATNDECSFGRCHERDDGMKFCSGRCVLDIDCSKDMLCSSIYYWCYPRDILVPPTSCDQASLKQCFSNEDCASDEQRCENLGEPDDEVLCCTIGARGTGVAGTSCTTGLECAYGRCIDGLCTAFCDDESPCPTTMVCNDYLLFCEPKP